MKATGVTASLQISRLALLWLVFATLAACGGGGSDDPVAGGGDGPPPPDLATAEGAYVGSLTGAPSGAAHFRAIVLENDDIWSLYGQDSVSMFTVYGFVQGSGISDNGSYTSSDAGDFGLIPAVHGNISASYNATAGTLSGTVSGGGTTTSFAGNRAPDGGYDYDSTATVDSITGGWVLQTLQGEFLTATVSPSGSFSFTSDSGCGGDGSIAPRASGKNVFDVTITFVNSDACALPGQSATGIGITYPIAATSQRQFMIAVTSADRTLGTAAFGIR